MSVIPTAGMGLSTASKELSELHNPEEIRKMSVSGEHPGLEQRQYGLTHRLDDNVSFEEYVYWAKVEREMEREENRRYLEHSTGASIGTRLKGYFTSKGLAPAGAPAPSSEMGHFSKETNAAATTTTTDEKTGLPGYDSQNSQEVVAIAPNKDIDAEWRTAARALRTSGWMTIFYLITTDILGWSQTPYVFASAGYGLAIGMFVIFGIAAACSGFFIWRTFLGLDSSRYPVLSFGDPFLRLFGKKTAHFINVLQAFQMFCSVAVVIMGNSQILGQLANGNVCYIAIVIINVVIGALSGWLRALKHLGWVCNFAVWINVVSFIIIMVAAVKFGPDPTYATQTTFLKDPTQPVTTFIGTPPQQFQQQTNSIFAAQFNAIDTIVYAYSGALLFVAFLAEMRHPMDFWKGMIMAQLFIMIVYIIFGAVVYTYLGQWSVTSITQVISPYGLQVTCNILALLTGVLAIFLYFHVGMKVVYLEVGQAIFGLPPITEKKGYYYWLALGPVYWILAMVLAVSVPNFTGITNLIGGLLSLNFTYSIPAIMYVAYVIQSAAALPGEGFNPETGATTRHDTGMKRWMRGIVKSWYITIPCVLFAMGGLASSGMGSWSAVISLEQIFGPGGTIQTSWGCAAPS